MRGNVYKFNIPMKRWDDNLLSLNIYKHGKKEDEKLNNTMKEARCQDVFINISKR
jgi:hypothetical protein